MEDDEGLNKDDLAINLFDFLIAGTETSSTTLKWLVLYLALHQDVQDRCREEIRGVVMVVVTLEAIQTELRILVLLCLLVTLLYLYFSHQEIYEMEIFLDPVDIS